MDLPEEEILSEPSPHAPDRTTVHFPKSTGSLVVRTANALTIGVDISDGEEAARHNRS
jgi:hypothetical protein